MSTAGRGSGVTALPGWWSSVHQAEQQALQSLRGSDVRTACTHVTDGIALVTVELGPGQPSPGTQHGHDRWATLARDAVADHQAHFGGRLFVFQGQCELTGSLSAADVIERTVIDELVVPGHPGRIPGTARVEGLDFVRPVFRQGSVVLTLRPTGPGVFQPFERARSAGVLRPTI
ncbi:hypothetical protein [Arsenicicoccus sp. oral taxon 190]|uniref:hypothetical protein n=1 Tax=Arsenicicoccus sp. oral taxon 190 TaxID=1658671 RepID=UPI00067D9EBB|nr:hypothetical protein [Arsenicicoccus sp. oral taxon 190]